MAEIVGNSHICDTYSFSIYDLPWLSMALIITDLLPLLLAWINPSKHGFNTSKHKELHSSYKVWDEIIYSFPNFDDTTLEVWEWKVIHLILNFACGYLSMLGLKLNFVGKRSHRRCCPHPLDLFHRHRINRTIQQLKGTLVFFIISL